MEDAPEYSKRLRELADEAKHYRNQEERSLCGDEVCLELSDWSRDWRKQFESHSLACEMREEQGEVDEAEACETIEEEAAEAP